MTHQEDAMPRRFDWQSYAVEWLAHLGMIPLALFITLYDWVEGSIYYRPKFKEFFR